MAELVDAIDSKSIFWWRSLGSSPSASTIKELIRTPQRFVFSYNYVIIENMGCDIMSKTEDINSLIIESKLSGEISTKEISDGHHTFE